MSLPPCYALGCDWQLRSVPRGPPLYPCVGTPLGPSTPFFPNGEVTLQVTRFSFPVLLPLLTVSCPQLHPHTVPPVSPLSQLCQ